MAYNQHAGKHAPARSLGHARMRAWHCTLERTRTRTRKYWGEGWESEKQMEAISRRKEANTQDSERAARTSLIFALRQVDQVLGRPDSEENRPTLAVAKLVRNMIGSCQRTHARWVF